MIQSFGCKEIEKLFNSEYSRKLPSSIQRVAFRKLRMLHRSSSVEDLRVPPGIGNSPSFWLGLQIDFDLDNVIDWNGKQIKKEVHKYHAV